MILTALLIGLASPPLPAAPPAHPAAAAAAERIAECDLGEVAIRYEEVLQSEVLIAAGTASVTDEQLACADRAADYHDLKLPPELQPRYDAIRQARLSALSLAEAQAWLAERGLLDRVPRYEPGVTDDEAFIRQLESLCGPRAVGVFQSKHGFLAVSPDRARRNLEPFEEGAEVFGCLINAATVAGSAIGFVGNEADPEED